MEIMKWVENLSRKLILLLLTLLAIVLVLFIIKSANLVSVQGERDHLNETNLNLVKNQLDDVSKLMGKLSSGPNGPGDNEMSDLVWSNKQAQLLKNSGVFTVLDDTPAFRKVDFRFSEEPQELQLLLYNLDRRMQQYHYQLNTDDRTRAKDLAKAIYELQGKVVPLATSAYTTSSEDLQKIKDYQAKADVVTKLSRDFIEVLKKE